MVPAAGTLDRCSIELASEDGVMLRDLAPGTELRVDTCHTCYRIVVIDGPGQRVLVSGGRFPADTEVRLDGSTAGGSMLRSGWIGVGLRLEFFHGDRWILTSRVRGIHIVPEHD